MVMNYCPHCGVKNALNRNFCSNCGTNLMDTQAEQMNMQSTPEQLRIDTQGEQMKRQLTPEQLRQVQLETIWMHEKTVPKWLRGTWQAKLSFNKLEQGLTESEKQYLKRRRDTE